MAYKIQAEMKFYAAGADIFPLVPLLLLSVTSHF